MPKENKDRLVDFDPSGENILFPQSVVDEHELQQMKFLYSDKLAAWWQKMKERYVTGIFQKEVHGG